MANDILDFMECARGLYEQAISLLSDQGDDSATLSGCILLAVGLEKLVKHALEMQSPLLGE